MANAWRKLKDLDDLDKAEAINLNGIPAPASWKFPNSLEMDKEKDGCRVLQMEREGDGWQGVAGGTSLIYSQEYGLAKAVKKPGG